MWKFSATSHGKGIVDGVGGKVKSIVRRKAMSKGKDAAIVQDSKSFAALAKSLCEKTTIIHIDSSEIEKYKEENKFDKAIEVNSILKMHVKEVNPQMTKLWRNSQFHTSLDTDIIKNTMMDKSEDVRVADIETEDKLTPINLQNDSNLMNINEVEVGMWVIVIYEDEKFLGKVLKKVSDQCCVRCLTKPFGIRTPQDMEREEDAVFTDIFIKQMCNLYCHKLTKMVKKVPNGHGSIKNIISFLYTCFKHCF